MAPPKIMVFVNVRTKCALKKRFTRFWGILKSFEKIVFLNFHGPKSSNLANFKLILWDISGYLQFFTTMVVECPYGAFFGAFVDLHDS